MAVSEIQKETFINLLEQIRSQVQLLKKQNKELTRENLKLKTKLDEIQNDQTDIFSSINESERIAMRHKITGLIEKIDHHLEGKS
jgi:ABC-type Zn uptake system ZnuABC Zn-binding protein ZnuA